MYVIPRGAVMVVSGKSHRAKMQANSATSFHDFGVRNRAI